MFAWRCHEALINLFPHFQELNLAAVALTHSKYPKNIYATKKLF